MALTNDFRDYLVQKLTGQGSAALFDASNAHIGVGDGTSVFSASADHDLTGTNKKRRPMEASYPTGSGSTMTFRSLFGTSDANFAWQEWGVFNGLTGGTMMNRVVQNNGTKASTETKQVTVTITLTV